MLALVAAPLHGAVIPLETPTPTPSATEAPEQGTIALEREDGTDERIAQRLGQVFANIPSLAGVEITVSEGVVTLSGTAADDAAIARAEAIALEFQGVVTVENGIERDVSVDIEEGLGGLEERMQQVW